MHFFSVPSTIQGLFRACTWRKKCTEKTIYLTFDDGPHPTITPWVIEQLEVYQAKATFFCVGENVMRYPDVCSLLLSRGHRLANHTMHHIKGWQTPNPMYFSDIEACEQALNQVIGVAQINSGHNESAEKRLFRPPYGQITPSQIRHLTTLGYEIVQWSDLSCDYDPKLVIEKSLNALTKNLKPGNIVVFHDSEKAFEQMKQILPTYLSVAHAKGYQFKTL
jgi:peptidoglycan-N-acetylglucosamine deacetylase